MAEILHHLGCMKPYKYWDKLPINRCRISAINSSIRYSVTKYRRKGSTIDQETQAIKHMISIQHVKTSSVIPVKLTHYINRENNLLLMEEILHQLIGSLSHDLQGFIHPRWCRISSINSITEVWSSFSGLASSLAFHPMVCVEVGGLLSYLEDHPI